MLTKPSKESNSCKEFRVSELLVLDTFLSYSEEVIAYEYMRLPESYK